MPMRENNLMAEMGQLAEARSRIYGLLASLCTQLPTPALAQAIKEGHVLDALSPLANTEAAPEDLINGLETLKAYTTSSRSEETTRILQDIAVERTRLFRGIKPGYGPPPPYESVYATGTDLGSNARKRVLEIYAEIGVNLMEMCKEEPDYIGLELDFMRILCQKEAEAWKIQDAEVVVDFLGREYRFVNEHLVTWVPRFCDTVLERTKLGFYRALAQIIKGTLTLDKDQIKNLLAAVRSV
jgi:TorA maturation chaperone TorD